MLKKGKLLSLQQFDKIDKNYEKLLMEADLRGQRETSLLTKETFTFRSHGQQLVALLKRTELSRGFEAVQLNETEDYSFDKTMEGSTALSHLATAHLAYVR